MPDRPFLDHVNVVVDDMDAAAEFYAHFGLDLATDAEWAPHHRSARTADGASLDLDSTPFAGVWDRGWPKGKPGILLHFTVQSREAVDALYDELVAAGYAGQQEPWDAFWGSRFAVVEDPDGNPVGFGSVPDDAHRKPAPEPPF